MNSVNNICNNSCNNSYNNNDKLFFKIIKNKFLFNIILNHLKIFNNVYIFNKNIKYRDFNIIVKQDFNSYVLFLNLSLLQEKYYNINLKEIKALFPFLQDLKLPTFFNDKISADDFGSNLKKITFGTNFNNNSFSFDVCNGKSVFHEGLETIEFGLNFKGEICKGSLPNSLKVLKLGNNWNLDAKYLQLPDEIEILSFGFNFKSDLSKRDDFKLPSKLKTLIIKSNITIDQDVLPFGLLKLYLYNYFKPFKSSKVLPASLEYIKFDDDYNCDLNGLLPDSLKTLKLGQNFSNRLLMGSIPPDLRKLSMGSYSFEIEPGLLPNSLTKLIMDPDMCTPTNYRILVPGSLPEGLKIFEMGLFFNFILPPKALPSSVRSIDINSGYSQKLVKDSIPNTIEEFIVSNTSCLDKDFFDNFDQFSNLKNLELDFKNQSKFKQIKLPNNIETFKSNLLLEQPLPDSITYCRVRLPSTKEQLSFLPQSNLKKLELYSITPTSVPLNYKPPDRFQIQLSSTIQYLEIDKIHLQDIQFNNLINLEILVVKNSIIDYSSNIDDSSISDNNSLPLNLPLNLKVLKLIKLRSINTTRNNIRLVLSNYTTIKYLEISYLVNLEFIEFPNSIEELVFLNNTNQYLSIPETVRKFTYNSYFKYIKSSLSSIKELSVDNLFDITDQDFSNLSSLEILNIKYPNSKTDVVFQVAKSINLKNTRINFINNTNNNHS